MPVRELLGKGSNWSNFFVHHFYWSSQTSQEWVAEIDVANKKYIYIRLIFPETVLKKEWLFPGSFLNNISFFVSGRKINSRSRCNRN